MVLELLRKVVVAECPSCCSSQESCSTSEPLTTDIFVSQDDMMAHYDMVPSVSVVVDESRLLRQDCTWTVESCT